MTEADLRLHLAKQTKLRIALFDVLKLALPEKEARVAFKKLLAEKPDAVLFDALDGKHLRTIGAILQSYASTKRPLFSVGSSGVEAALAANLVGDDVRSLSSDSAFPVPRSALKMRLVTSSPTNQVLIGSGSCSPVTSGQIAWALKHGFSEIPMDAAKLSNASTRTEEIERATRSAAALLQAGRSVIVHSTKLGSNKRIAAKLKSRTAEVLGSALGRVLRGSLEHSPVGRICIAGGDTSSYAARAMGIEALEMVAPLTPGAPLCRAHAPDSPIDGREVVFKGGQVGGENYFEIVRKGKA